MIPDPKPTLLSEEELADAMAAADGCLGSAQRELSDPHLRALAARAIRGEITVEEALRQVRVHLGEA